MIGGEIGRPVSNSTGPGTPMPMPHSGPGMSRVVARSGVEERVDAVQAGVRTRLDPRGLVVMAEDPAVQGRDGDVDARGAEVGDEDVARIGPERQLARWPAARARPDVAFADEAAFDQLADPLGDDRPAEARPRDELRARARPAEADLVEDDDERVERLVRAAGVARLRAGDGSGRRRPTVGASIG